MNHLTDIVGVGLAAGAWLSILQLSDFLVHVINLFVRRADEKLISYDDLIQAIEVRPKIVLLAELLECPLCLGTWLCAAFACLAACARNLSGAARLAEFALLWFGALPVAVAVRLGLEHLYENTSARAHSGPPPGDEP